MKVLELEDVLKSLVIKYNNGYWDEDLMQIAWVRAIECEKTFPDADKEELKAKTIVWVKNTLINHQQKERLRKHIPIPTEWDKEAPIDLDYYITDLKLSLTEREIKVLDLLLDGKSVNEICDELNLKKSTVYNIFNKIKGKMHG